MTNNEQCAKVLGWSRDGVYWLRPGFTLIRLPNFEGSVDACMEHLVPEVLRRLEARADTIAAPIMLYYEAGEWVCEVRFLAQDGDVLYAQATADTPAKAIVAAFLAAFGGAA
jgi:hypothetical protein